MSAENRQTAPGFMTYREAALIFSLIGDAEAAQAIKATVNYYLYGKEPERLDGMAQTVFSIMKNDIDRNNEKYSLIVERNRENGRKGGRPKHETPKE